MRCRAEYGAFVFLQDFKPVAEIGGMVVPDFERDAEVCREKGRAKFGNKFFPCIAMIAKALGIKAAV